MKTVLYARVSTKEQAEEGYSLSAQVGILRDYAGRKALTIEREFVIPESARGKVERKAFGEMLDFLGTRGDVTVILAEKVDRITRNFKDAVKLDDWLNGSDERQIHFVKQSLVIHRHAKSHEKFQWDIYLALARQYSNNLSEEVRKGLAQKAEEGWFPGNKKRGYISIGDSGHKTWVIDDSPESEAPYIKRAFHLYGTGAVSLKRICQLLQNEGWKNISKSQLHLMLMDPFYCGEFSWRGTHYIAAGHQPLISKAVFRTVQEHLKRKTSGKPRKHLFLFGNGLLTCGECGRAVIGAVQKGHHYYYCTRFERDCSQRTYVREENLDAQVLEFFGTLQSKNQRLLEWVKKALKASHRSEIEYQQRITQDLDKKFEQLQKRIDALYDDKVDGKIDEDFFQRKFQQYKGEQAATINRKNWLLEANTDYINLGLSILELSQRARAIYTSLSKPEYVEEKRKLLKMVFLNLPLKDGKLSPDYVPAFQVIAESAKSGDWLGD